MSIHDQLAGGGQKYRSIKADWFRVSMLVIGLLLALAGFLGNLGGSLST